MPTLHVVGDSISMHYGPYLEQYLQDVLVYSRKEGMPGDPAEPNGANGGDSSLVLRYLSACQAQHAHWDYLLLNCGLHDIKTNPLTHDKQVPPETYRSNLRRIIPLARSLASWTIWVRTVPVIDAIQNARQKDFRRFAADVLRYNSIADGVMEEHDIPEINLYGFTRRLGEDIDIDHVHFRERASQRQAAYIAGFIAKMLDVLETPDA